MDELTAYRTLRLQPGASGGEIKAAYAELSKEFHPEEYPDEFQRIHEAYVLLGRGRRTKGAQAENDSLHEKKEKPSYDFSGAEKEKPFGASYTAGSDGNGTAS